MDDLDDPTFSEGTQGQSSFIVLASQDETQQESQVEDQMAKYIKRLPGLQDPDKHHMGLEPASTDEEQGRDKTRVLVSDTDSVYKTDVTAGPSDYISESDSEADVTVIQKKSSGDSDSQRERTRSRKPSNGSLSNGGSSFQSKNRSNLGSYDQCEVYKTQQGHAKGDRFQFQPSSQDDMFAETGEKHTVCTPSTHLESLQFSQKPMLVPETVEESLDAIPPSPGVYSTPVIIPSSPSLEQAGDQSNDSQSMFETENQSVLEIDDQQSAKVNQSKYEEGKQEEAEESQSVFDVNADNTLASQPQEDDRVSREESSSNGEREGPSEHVQEVSDYGRSSESLHLHLSESTLNTENTSKMAGGKHELGRRRLHTPVSSQKLHGTLPPSQEPEVIVIQSGSAPYPIEVDESQDFSLRMTPSQARSTQGQMSQNKDKPDDLPDTSEAGTFRSGNELKQSEGELSNKDKKRNTTDLHSGGSQGDREKQSKSQPRSRSERKQEKLDRERQRMYDNPLVKWASESDIERENLTGGKSSARFSDEFHISVPKDTSMADVMIDEVDISTQPQAAQHTYREKTLPDTIILPTSTSDSRRELPCPDRGEEMPTSDIDKESPTGDPARQKLSLGMIQSESETTQPVFKLHKPEIEESSLLEETEEVFPRATKKHGARYILEDSDEEYPVKPGEEEESGITGDNILGDPGEEILTAKKLEVTVQEFSEMTEAYEAPTVVDMDENGNNDASKHKHTAVENTTATVDNTSAMIPTKDPISEAVSKTRTRKLTESSTQTQEKQEVPFETVDINVAQKVAEYLQSGYSPRSRSSSTCTEHSDLHGEGSEKGDGTHKTPKRKDRAEKIKTPARSPKSPQEIQEIIKTYSNIIQKKQLQKLKSVDDKNIPSSQRPNPGGGEYDQQGDKLIARRLSSQSLPEGLLSCQGRSATPSLVRNVSQSVSSDPWMSVRKPQYQLSSSSDRGSQKPADGASSKLEKKSKTETNTSDSANKNVKLSSTPDKMSQEITEKKTSNSVTPEKERNTSQSNVSLIGKPDNNSPNKVSEISAKIQSTMDLPSGTQNADFAKENITQTVRSMQNQVSLLPSASLEIVLEKIDAPKRTKDSKKSQHSSKPVRIKKRLKRRLSAEKRNEVHRKTDSVSPQTVSGSFVSSTQKFAVSATTSPELTGKDPYSFHSTQSQKSATEGPSVSHGRTPLSSRKRQRMQHKKSGLKKPRQGSPEAETGTQGKLHVTFRTSPKLSSQSSDVTVTTIGSLPSIPSSISQSSPRRDTVLSPTSSSGRQSASEEVSMRLSGKRLSVEQSLSDTLPLTQNEEDNYQRVTVVEERVEQLIRNITTRRKVIGPRGQILENVVQTHEPVIVEEKETTHKKIQYIYIPSPSRSVSSLTSGDLGDISSSLSKSSVSSGSLGSKVGSLTSSLDQTTGTAIEEQQTGAKMANPSHVSETNKTGKRMAAPAIIPRTRMSSGSLSVNQSVTSAREQQQQQQQEVEQQTRSVAGIQQQSPDRDGARHQIDAQTPGPSSSNLSKPSTPAVISDQEVSDVVTPLGSTINKTGSYMHSRTTSVESPKASDSLFSSSSDDSKKNSAITGTSRPERGTSVEASTSRHQDKTDDTSDQVSSEIPYQDQCVSSSSTPEDSVAMVTSAGTIGSRVIAKWRDGFYYPGTLKSSADRYSKYHVLFDDGDSLLVKGTDILLIQQLPVGQSVMVLTDDGDFEFGLITKSSSDCYTVETDAGTSGRYSFSQVILSGDQADCILSDHGTSVVLQVPTTQGLPANVGDVSLENLLDAPRRSAKKDRKQETEPPQVNVKAGGHAGNEGQGHSARGQKRKFDSLKPQATSTPTPKGKSESVLGKRRKTAHLTESPVIGLEASPLAVRKSPRKTRVGLFTRDLGPIPSKKIFRNIYFLLTNVDKTKEQQEQEKKLVLDLSTDTSTDDSAVEDEMSVPFDKEHLKSQITAGGGILLDNLDEKILSTGKRRILLLSSTYQRTVKYLQCLASGIPCVSHMWVVDCCTKDELLDEKSYQLPAGISLERRKLMEWRKKTDVFQGINAVVYSKNSKFVDSWTLILKMAKCHVHSQLQYNNVHVIVTDNSCTAVVERQAESNQIPLVGTEWAIQCLVNGKIVSYTGHPRYKHDAWI